MTSTEWPADDYAIGSYIQATVSDMYLPQIPIQPNDTVLDIGCGDGSYSLKIMNQFQPKALLGIDRSNNMLRLAKKITAKCPNITLQKMDVESMAFHNEFDDVISFWCLQWTSNIQHAFQNIFQALKKGGKVFCILPTGDDPLITSFNTIKQSGQFKVLERFITPINYQQFQHLEDTLATIPFKKIVVKRCHHTLLLPSLDIFRKFLNGVAFYQGQVPMAEIRELNEAMVNVFLMDCQEKYQGQLRFEFSLFMITGEKN